jgi:predicted MFS family arabinose efflux permease
MERLSPRAGVPTAALAFLLAAVGVEVVFFVMLGPLLPHYATVLHLGRTGAGILSGSYAFGCGLVALPAGLLVARWGAHRVTIAGLVLVGAACLAFALGSDVYALDAARLAQGVGGAAVWAGAISWLLSLGEGTGRGRLIGLAFSAAGVGACLGPALGALGSVVGTRGVFIGIACAILALAGAGAVLARRPLPALPPTSIGPAAALAQPQARAAIAFVALPSLAFGAGGVLLPLRLHALGASATVIAAAFIGTAVLDVIVNPPVGRWYDGPSRRRVFHATLALSIVLTVLVGLPLSEGGLLVVMVLAWPILGLLWIPGLADLTAAVERIGGGIGLALGLFNLAWAIFQALGSIAGPALARIGEATPFIALAVLFAVGLAAIARGRTTPTEVRS